MHSIILNAYLFKYFKYFKHFHQQNKKELSTKKTRGRPRKNKDKIIQDKIIQDKIDGSESSSDDLIQLSQQDENELPAKKTNERIKSGKSNNKKKVSNEIRMFELNNPQLESLNQKHSFLIYLPATIQIDNQKMISYYESNIQPVKKYLIVKMTNSLMQMKDSIKSKLALKMMNLLMMN